MTASWIVLGTLLAIGAVYVFVKRRRSAAESRALRRQLIRLLIVQTAARQISAATQRSVGQMDDISHRSA